MKAGSSFRIAPPFLALLVAALASLFAAAPAMAERITAYWKLDTAAVSGPASVTLGSVFLEQRLIPVKLVRLSVPALAAGVKEPVAAGTLLYLVVNEAGRSGYCTPKDMSAGNLASSLFIPALDKRPCFVDRDGDGRFDASFEVFEAYEPMSPPQPRGSIDAAKPLAQPSAYEQVDPRLFVVPLKYTLQLVGGDRPDKIRVRRTFEKPGSSEWFDDRGKKTPQGYEILSLTARVRVKSVVGGAAEIELLLEPDGHVFGDSSGIGFLPKLPDNPALK